MRYCVAAPYESFGGVFYVIADQNIFGVCLVRPSDSFITSYIKALQDIIQTNFNWINGQSIPETVLATIKPKSYARDATTVKQRFQLRKSLIEKIRESKQPAPKVVYLIPEIIQSWNTIKDTIDTAGRYVKQNRYRVHRSSQSTHYAIVRLIQMALINARQIYCYMKVYSAIKDGGRPPSSLERLSVMLSDACSYGQIISCLCV